MNLEAEKLAKKIWDYHHMNQKLEKADVILVLGSHDLVVAEYAANLFLAGWAPLIVFSGGLGQITSKLWDKPEAEVFAEIAIKQGIPRDKILIENKSTNTGENILFTRRLLKEKGVEINSCIAVQKPYMERRTWATLKKLWPELKITVTSPDIPFEEYAIYKHRVATKGFIDVLVGDLQRIREYPSKGFQIPQEIPDDVWDAYEKLVALGYTKHLVKE